MAVTLLLMDMHTDRLKTESKSYNKFIKRRNNYGT